MRYLTVCLNLFMLGLVGYTIVAFIVYGPVYQQINAVDITDENGPLTVFMTSSLGSRLGVPFVLMLLFITLVLNVVYLISSPAQKFIEEVSAIKEMQQDYSQRLDELFPGACSFEVHSPTIYDVLGARASLLCIYNELYKSGIKDFETLVLEDKDRLKAMCRRVRHFTVALALIGLPFELREKFYSSIGLKFRELIEKERVDFSSQLKNESIVKGNDGE